MSKGGTATSDIGQKLAEALLEVDVASGVKYERHVMGEGVPELPECLPRPFQSIKRRGAMAAALKEMTSGELEETLQRAHLASSGLKYDMVVRILNVRFPAAAIERMDEELKTILRGRGLPVGGEKIGFGRAGDI